jgi:1-acyl-sn-glycerol-3-phosphate acyltransferase
VRSKRVIRGRTGPVSQSIGRVCLRLIGWREASGPPPIRKYVLVAAPHTTNMDLFYMLFATMAMRIPVTWMMKDTVFWWPLGSIWRMLGGIPVNRRAASNVVRQMVDVFNESEDLALLIAPEGTRKAVDHWKLGFYWMALGANVPVVPGYINHQIRRIGVGDPIPMTGDIEADFEKLRDFYREKTGIYPDYDERQARRNPLKRDEASE